MERCEECVNWIESATKYDAYGVCEACFLGGRDVSSQQMRDGWKPMLIAPRFGSNYEHNNYESEDFSWPESDQLPEAFRIYEFLLLTRKDHCCKCWERKAV